MRMMNPENFAKARAYLLDQARPLDRALYLFHFEEGPAAAVWQELASYQNADGGFGHALEPDLRTPTSSALATGVALRMLAETGAPPGHPLVQEALDYLKQTLEPRTLTWRVAPLDSNEHPHAPWWHDEDGSLSATFDAYQIIPRAELVAFLHHFSEPALEPWLEKTTGAAILAVEGLPLGGGGGDDLVYTARLAGAAHLSQDQRDRLLRRLREAAAASVTREPAEWAAYSIPPLKLAPAPGSFLADLFPEAIQQNLDYLIERQAPLGHWEPTWTWGDFYPEVWPAARDEWRGEITLQNLLTLRAYGRVA